MKEKMTFDYQSFIELPPETQVKIIQFIDDDQTLMSILSANKTIHSHYLDNKNLIFSPRVKSQVTEQKVADYFAVYLNYKQNQGKKSNDNPEQHTALSYMVFKGYEKAVAVYMEQMESRVGLLHKARHAYNLVHLAILSGNIKMLKLILNQPEAQHLINEPNDYRASPIHFAAKTANHEILQSLVEHPSFDSKSMNAKAQYDYSPLAYYCMYSDKDDVSFAKKMINYGAEVNEKKCINGIPCVIAIEHSKPKVSLYLCQFAQDQLDGRAVEKAFNKGYKDIVLFLMKDYKIQPKVECDFSHSLLKNAVCAQDCELMQLAFDLEKPIYEELAQEKSKYTYTVPNLNDYLLKAMECLLSNRANAKTQIIYSKLLELGFCFTMHDSYENKNIIDLLKKNIANFTWGKEEVFNFAKPIIQDMLERFTSNVPNEQLAEYEAFEKSIMLSAEKTGLEYEKEMAEVAEMMSDFSQNSEKMHDDHDRTGCAIS